MVTSWEGVDGSRIVLTTTNTSTMKEKAGQTPAVTNPDQPSNPVYPYAAVATRDGWLVFQLKMQFNSLNEVCL